MCYDYNYTNRNIYIHKAVTAETFSIPRQGSTDAREKQFVAQPSKYTWTIDISIQGV